MMRIRWMAVVAALVGVLPVAGSASAQETQRVVTGESGRQSVNLTIYNNNLALVRETRRVELPNGQFVLRYEDVAKAVRPEGAGALAAGEGSPREPGGG